VLNNQIIFPQNAHHSYFIPFSLFISLFYLDFFHLFFCRGGGSSMIFIGKITKGMFQVQYKLSLKSTMKVYGHPGRKRKTCVFVKAL